MKKNGRLLVLIIILIVWNISLQLSLHSAEEDIIHIKASVDTVATGLQNLHKQNNELKDHIQQKEKEALEAKDAQAIKEWERMHDKQAH